METIQLDPFLILCTNLHMIEGHKCEKQNSVLIEKHVGKKFFLRVGVKGWKLNITSDSKDERVRWKIFKQLTCSCTAILKLRKKSESESHSVVFDSLWPHGNPPWNSYSPWNPPGQNTGVGSLSLLQRIFPTQGLNPCLLHCKWILYQLSHKGSPKVQRS